MILSVAFDNKTFALIVLSSTVTSAVAVLPPVRVTAATASSAYFSTSVFNAESLSSAYFSTSVFNAESLSTAYFFASAISVDKLSVRDFVSAVLAAVSAVILLSKAVSCFSLLLASAEIKFASLVSSCSRVDFSALTAISLEIASPEIDWLSSRSLAILADCSLSI